MAFDSTNQLQAIEDLTAVMRLIDGYRNTTVFLLSAFLLNVLLHMNHSVRICIDIQDTQ